MIFQEPDSERSPSSSYSIALLTVNPVASNDYSTVTVTPYYATGSGSSLQLHAATSFSITTSSSSQIKVPTFLSGDVDGDGDDDIVEIVYTSGHTYAQVYPNNANGTFGAKVAWETTTTGATQAFLVNVDGDTSGSHHKLDLVLAYVNGSSYKWNYYLSSGSSFSSTATAWPGSGSSFGNSTDRFFSGDIDGDYKADIVRARPDSTNGNKLVWKLLTNLGTDSRINTGWGYSGDSFLFTDVTGDNHADVVRFDNTTDGTTDVKIGQYASGALSSSGSAAASNIGTSVDQFALYGLDWVDSYSDVLKYSSSTLTMYMSSGGSSYNTTSPVTTLSSTTLNAGYNLLFGSFGSYTETTECPEGIAAVEDDPDADWDSDGFTPNEGDCDDTADHVYPGAPEYWDGIDEDCDGDIDEAFDLDGDGYSADEGDCNELTNGQNPGMIEILDGVDNDCNGEIDDPTPDSDLDSDGFTPNEGDCDDTADHAYPGAPEYWDGIDEDCDGQIDEAFDLDGDGYSSDEGDCNELTNGQNPGMVEIPDGIDNDCDGIIDEEPSTEDFEDYTIADVPTGDYFNFSIQAISGTGLQYVGFSGDMALCNGDGGMIPQIEFQLDYATTSFGLTPQSQSFTAYLWGYRNNSLVQYLVLPASSNGTFTQVTFSSPVDTVVFDAIVTDSICVGYVEYGG